MESIYGQKEPAMRAIMERLTGQIEEIRKELAGQLGMDPVDHVLSRIKSEESMREKCRRRNLPETVESATERIYDAIGIRVVCGFLNDVYLFREKILELPGVSIAEEKDYIRRAKPNGYRSLHLILRVSEGFYAEIQLRTISMDTWAALEHQLKYKKELGENTALIVEELRRCANELASTDVSMQTIRDMIWEESGIENTSGRGHA